MFDPLYPIGAFTWDPPREAFTLPFFDHPVYWYGLFFVAGFVLAYFILSKLFSRFLLDTRDCVDASAARQAGYALADRMCWFAVIGTVVGARLGDVLFYNWSYFKEHPQEIFMVWKGGLASHGGVLGVLLALYFYSKIVRKKHPKLTFIRILDYTSIPTALVACFIRIGNFINQEIIGTPTQVPWAVRFLHPAEAISPVPRHPVQLYEAFAYLITFIVLWTMWRCNPSPQKEGGFIGTMFILIFGSRFFLEFWKSPLASSLGDVGWIQIGQLLSLPFILLGAILLVRSRIT